MNQSDKEALKETLTLMGIAAAILLGAFLISLVVCAIMQAYPIAAIIILIVAVLLLCGIITFFVMR